VAAGEVMYPDGTTDQFDQSGSQQRRVSIGPAGLPRMIIDIQVGAGQLEIQTPSGTAVTTTPSPSAAKPSPTAKPSPSAVTASPTASN
jgi:hypothetical protein